MYMYVSWDIPTLESLPAQVNLCITFKDFYYEQLVRGNILIVYEE